MLKMVRGDVDGFFGLALDNLVQLLVIVWLCMGVLGFPAEVVYGRILPGAAVSLIIGNLFYAWQARKLMAQTGRDDICALPYGINTPSVFLFIFLVMLPAKFAAEGAGLSSKEAAIQAWQIGLLACFGSGVIEVVGSFVAERIRKATPRAALLSTLAGIAVGFISMPFLFKAYAHPLVGLVPFGVILIGYFGGVRFKFGLPVGLVAVLLGTVLAWTTGFDRGTLEQGVGFYPPIPVLGDLFTAFNLIGGGNAAVFLSVV